MAILGVSVAAFWAVWLGAMLIMYGVFAIPVLGKISFLRDAAFFGKLKEGSSSLFHRLLNVPKRWFSHFYILGCLWNAILLKEIMLLTFVSSVGPRRDVPLLTLLFSPDPAATGASNANRPETSPPLLAAEWGELLDCLMCLVLVQLHVVRRALECLFLHRFSKAARIHVGHYVLGVTFYIALPLSYLNSPSLLGKLLANGGALGVGSASGGHLSFGSAKGAAAHTAVALLDAAAFRHLAGLLLFLVGAAVQWHSHYTLAALRASPGAVAAPQHGRPVERGTEAVSSGAVVGGVEEDFGAMVPAPTTPTLRHLSKTRSRGVQRRQPTRPLHVAEPSRSGATGEQHRGEALGLGLGLVTGVRRSSDTSLPGVVAVPSVPGTVYAIPHSGMFRLVSSPHYSAEILVYLALAICNGLPRSLVGVDGVGTGAVCGAPRLVARAASAWALSWVSWPVGDALGLQVGAVGDVLDACVSAVESSAEAIDGTMLWLQTACLERCALVDAVGSQATAFLQATIGTLSLGSMSALVWPPALVVMFTVANLSFTAVHSHRWYRHTFGTLYPPGRKALVPFLF